MGQFIRATTALQHAGNQLRRHRADVLSGELSNRKPSMTQHHVAQFMGDRAVAAHDSLPHLHEFPVGERDPLAKNARREWCILDIHHAAVRVRPAMCDVNYRALPPRGRGQHLVHRSNDQTVTACTASREPHDL